MHLYKITHAETLSLSYLVLSVNSVVVDWNRVVTKSTTQSLDVRDFGLVACAWTCRDLTLENRTKRPT